MEDSEIETLSIVKKMNQPVCVVSHNWKREFIASLEALVKQGFLSKKKKGILTSYSLTQKGKEVS
ncbi:MAG: hypothetical protein ABSB10_00645 [Candidatus Bathyarchaeia archaeon]|jgi:predicted transcriptional regulator